MRVVLAPQRFAGTLTAGQAVEAMALGWRRRSAQDELVRCPLSDGGPGFVAALHARVGGTLVPAVVAGPDRNPVPAEILLAPGADGAPTGYVEAAQACAPAGSRGSSAGVGELIAAAWAAGASRVVIGVGGCGSDDAGAGLLSALGATDPEAALRIRRGRDLVLASDVDDALDPALAAPPGATAALTRQPGAGAGGGLGLGLLLLGARREPGAQVAVDAAGLGDAVAGADLVVTGEGSFDRRSLRGSVAVAVTRTAQRAGVPVVVLAGQVLAGRRELQAIGVDAAYPVARSAPELSAALDDPAGTLAARAERVARTWSR